MAMSKEEYERWKAEVKALPGEFVLDGIHCTIEDFLAYKPTAYGIGFYLMINKGIVHMGAYKGAIPHIGEAEFKIDGSWNLKNLERCACIIKGVIKSIAGEHIHDHLYSAFVPAGQCTLMASQEDKA